MSAVRVECRFGLAPYTGSHGARLTRRALRGTLAAMVVGLAVPLAGCSYQLGSMLEGEEPKGRTITSSARTPELGSKAVDADLIYAKAAATELLSKDLKDESQPWENPRTGARGTITPIAAVYEQDGFKCRDFLASYIAAGKETWLQGDACRIHQGRWEVRTLRPWKQT